MFSEYFRWARLLGRGGLSKSSMHCVSDVPEFIGITHNIDSDDAPMLDLKGSRLEYATSLDGDEPRQTVDKAIAHEARAGHGIHRRKR
jgi:hypothetical protein